MARDDLHFRLRIPDDLKARIEEAAQRNQRSMTGEIIARLQQSFANDETTFSLEVRIEQLEARMKAVEAELRRD